MVVVSLDAPPPWWSDQAADHLTADEARKFADTDGQWQKLRYSRHSKARNDPVPRMHALPGVNWAPDPRAGKVLVLTNPKSAGYTQNPISVYYCYSKSGVMGRCIAEASATWQPSPSWGWTEAGA